MKIYLDNAATTAIDRSVQKIINRISLKNFANASSVHTAGLEAKKNLENARQTIARSLNAEPKEIIFTGSGTEANNFVVKGLFFQNFPDKNHIITTQIEHDCILNACRWLETKGAEVTYLPVNEQGFVNPEDLKKAITDKTFLVSIIHGNNEIGTIQDLKTLSQICHEKGVLFHTDACQSYTKVPLNIKNDGLDLATINAHKIHGPKGVGGLFIKRGLKIQPLLHGGGQEFGLRSSTENLAGITGFAKAVELVKLKDIQKMSELRDWFIQEILKIEGARLNGPTGNNRLCNNINLSFFMIEGEMLRNELNRAGIFISTGSACSSSSQKTSHVIKAIGCPMEYIHGNIRISLSKYTTKKELMNAAKILKHLVQKNKMHSL
ncbi:TPA: cysteine desulfurase NifS [Candidatus Uhrbacteria bacterium]|nr:cysteine desulfurase NifS [Candidatus Uhrbacteria bacterium]